MILNGIQIKRRVVGCCEGGGNLSNSNLFVFVKLNAMFIICGHKSDMHLYVGHEIVFHYSLFIASFIWFKAVLHFKAGFIIPKL